MSTDARLVQEVVCYHTGPYSGKAKPGEREQRARAGRGARLSFAGVAEPLGTDEIRLHLLDLTSDEGDWDVLDATERSRALAIHAGVRRRRFVATRTRLRCTLADYTGARPADLDIRVGRHGKPYLFEGGGLELSLAHTGDVALIAVARGAPIGVDVERTREERAYAAVLRRFFAAHVADEIQSLAPGRRAAEFYRLWTAHEAYVKATGTGLELAKRIDPCRDLRPYRVVTFALPAGLCASVCWRGAARRIVWEGIANPPAGLALTPER